jgi:iron-sulfur cluster repair protein YtfE (RIC family)
MTNSDSPDSPDSEGGRALTGLERPLDVIDACHERVRRMSEMLIRLSEHLDEHGADDRAAVSAQSILDCFNGMWLHHLRDEELDLWPRLRQRLQGRRSTQARRLLSAINTLAQQHRTLQAGWKQIEPSLQAVRQRKSMRLNGAAVHAFVAAYRAHVDLEEDVLAPASRQLLAAEDVEQIGLGMARRRAPKAAPEGGQEQR